MMLHLPLRKTLSIQNNLRFRHGTKIFKEYCKIFRFGLNCRWNFTLCPSRRATQSQSQYIGMNHFHRSLALSRRIPTHWHNIRYLLISLIPQQIFYLEISFHRCRLNDPEIKITPITFAKPNRKTLTSQARNSIRVDDV